MSSTSESGHAKNIANFEKIHQQINSFGSDYNPSRDNLKKESIQTLLQSAKENLNQLHAEEAVWKKAVADREAAFVNFGKLITRVHNALRASGSTVQQDESIKGVFRKLQGQRLTPRQPQNQNLTPENSAPVSKEISSSQMSFDSKLDNFSKLITFLENITEYAPNESDLTVQSLNTLYESLALKNNAVFAALAQLNKSRIQRNSMLYAPFTGLVALSTDIKSYIKSVYGASSPQYKALSVIKLTTYKI